MEASVGFDEEVIDAAVDAEFGFGIDFFGHGEEVVVSSLVVGAEDAAELFAEVVIASAVAVGEGHGSTVGGGRDEAVGVVEGEADASVAAHAESADGPAGFGGEPAFDEFGKLFADGGGEFVAFDGVAVEASAAVGHDDEEGEAFDVAFDAGSASPDRVVVAEAVELEENVVGAGALGDDADGLVGFLEGV